MNKDVHLHRYNLKCETNPDDSRRRWTRTGKHRDRLSRDNVQDQALLKKYFNLIRMIHVKDKTYRRRNMMKNSREHGLRS